jgi:Pterin-4a-carbinolamine dehydratase
MKNLADESCDCRHLPLSSEEEIESLLPQLLQWKIQNDGKFQCIAKDFKFKDFATALQRVNQVGEIAEAMGHHPDLKLGWGYLNISISTHSVGGLSRADFILAAKIDRII